MSASASGDSGVLRALGELGEGALGALRAQIAGHGALQVADRDGGAPEPECGRHRRPRQLVEHEHVGLQALDRLGRLQQGDATMKAMTLAAMLHSTPCVSGSKRR